METNSCWPLTMGRPAGEYVSLSWRTRLSPPVGRQPWLSTLTAPRHHTPCMLRVHEHKQSATNRGSLLLPDNAESTQVSTLSANGNGVQRPHPGERPDVVRCNEMG